MLFYGGKEGNLHIISTFQLDAKVRQCPRILEDNFLLKKLNVDDMVAFDAMNHAKFLLAPGKNLLKSNLIAIVSTYCKTFIFVISLLFKSQKISKLFLCYLSTCFYFQFWTGVFYAFYISLMLSLSLLRCTQTFSGLKLSTQGTFKRV